MASRKDYVAVAEVIKTSLDAAANDVVSGYAIAAVARGLADTFKRDNARFRYDTFFEACGLDSFGDVE